MKPKKNKRGVQSTADEPSTISESTITQTDMANSAATKAFCAALKEHWEAEKMTDAIIHCDGQDFKVHALVLSLQSEFFAKAFNGAWKESKGMKEVSLEEVEVDVVKAMLRFMYSFDYNGPDNVSTLLFDAKVYSAADRYLIPRLQAHAKDKFKAEIDDIWKATELPADLAVVIQEVYSSTPSTDRGLRDLVVSSCHGRLAAISKYQEFRTVLDETFGFAGDLVIFGANPPVRLCIICKQRNAIGGGYCCGWCPST
ncbi:BTB/POZ domain-containing protein [Xylaria curta]|nr:BTB/POZ domain-containing protein [Xylaria curta]